MKIVNWKTSLAGFCAAVPQVLPVIGLAMPEPVSKLITGVFIFIAFLLAKDKDVTGGVRG